MTGSPTTPLTAASPTSWGRLAGIRPVRADIYDVRAEGASGGGIAAGQVTLYLGRRVPVRRARRRLGQSAEGGEGGYVESLRVGCLRLGARRVACMIASG